MLYIIGKIPIICMILSKNNLNYTFYLFRMNINYVFLYSANPINTRVLKIN